jgi:hypothetical protein
MPGVYTIWHNDGRFIYAGMTGKASPPKTKWGLFTRLQTLWTGKRSVGSFAVYVAERFVLATLTQEEITTSPKVAFRWTASFAGTSTTIFPTASW